MGDTGNVSVSDFWEQRYRTGDAGWDLGQPSPPFVALLNGPDCPAPGRVVVVGSGRGHDALLFARHGFTVTGVDFAPSAVTAAQTAAEQAGLPATFVQADFFTLPATHAGAFDYVLEHTFFCAIDPARRPEYVEVVHALLRPGGELIGLFYAHGRSGGPPWTTDADEIRRLFAPRFTVERLEVAADSAERRRGQELLARLRAVKQPAAGTAAS